MTKPTIMYVKKEVDGVTSEEIHIRPCDIRYPTSGGTETHMSLQQAHELLALLSAKLSEYPY